MVKDSWKFLYVNKLNDTCEVMQQFNIHRAYTQGAKVFDVLLWLSRKMELIGGFFVYKTKVIIGTTHFCLCVSYRRRALTCSHTHTCIRDKAHLLAFIGVRV